MRVYEQYESAKEKREAQKGAKRGKPTGKARGYIFVFDENGMNSRGFYDASATLFDIEPGGAFPSTGMGGTGVSLDYLRANCRKVGGIYLKGGWKKAWERWRKPYTLPTSSSVKG